MINSGIKKEKKKSRPMKSNKREMLAPAEQHLLEIGANVERISGINTWLSDLAVLYSLKFYPQSFPESWGLRQQPQGPPAAGETSLSKWKELPAGGKRDWVKKVNGVGVA